MMEAYSLSVCVRYCNFFLVLAKSMSHGPCFLIASYKNIPVILDEHLATGVKSSTFPLIKDKSKKINLLLPACPVYAVYFMVLNFAAYPIINVSHFRYSLCIILELCELHLCKVKLQTDTKDTNNAALYLLINNVMHFFNVIATSVRT